MTEPSEPALGPPLGLFRFAIEGRRAPALFVTGWLATLVGGGITLVGILSPGGPALFLAAVGLGLLAIGLVLLGALLAWRATAWTVQVAPRSATVTQPTLHASEPSRGG